MAATLLAACSGPESRYSHRQDAAPSHTLLPEQVVDATPLPAPILAAGNKSPYTVNGVTYEVLSVYRGYRERGVASWYGVKFNGHATSNGEIFDMYRASAAHRTLPIPCFARVTNLNNDKQVIVRVNDRGPFHPERLIDLSYAAAVKLGFADKGTAPVEVEVIDVAGVDDRRKVPLGEYRYLQLGAFRNEAAARQLQTAVQAIVEPPVQVSSVAVESNYLYRVRVGPAADAKRLQALQRTLMQHGFDPGQPLP